MVVDGRDFEPALAQLRDDRIDFAFEQDEIAHRHRFAMRRLEGDPAAERERRFDRDAVESHRQIGAREAITMNVACHRRLPAERLIDLLPVELFSAKDAIEPTKCSADQEREIVHACLSPIEWVSPSYGRSRTETADPVATTL